MKASRGLGSCARCVEFFAELALCVPSAAGAGLKHGRHDRFDPGLGFLPLGAQRAQNHRLDDHHDLVWVGVMGADLRPLVGIEEALEQRAENRRVDEAQSRLVAAKSKPISFCMSASGGRPLNKPPLNQRMFSRLKSPPSFMSANNCSNHCCACKKSEIVWNLCAASFVSFERVRPDRSASGL